MGSITPDGFYSRREGGNTRRSQSNEKVIPSLWREGKRWDCAYKADNETKETSL